MSWNQRIRALAVVVLLLVGIFFWIDLEPSHRPLPPVVEPSEKALRIHREATVVDLHADSLLWPRDLNRRQPKGQLDFPRMREGGLDVVALATSTRFFGAAGLKAFHDLWPWPTWFSPWARCQHQISRMRTFLEASSGRVRLATTAEEIHRNHREGAVSFFYGIEGAHALQGDISRVERVARQGVVYIGLVHLSNNNYGGTSTLGGNEGLTNRGRALIQEMNRVGLMVDLAHASPSTFDSALELTTRPPLVSHAGARAIHDSWRNLSDDQIRALAARGGLIGVMLAPPALSRPDLREAIEHLEHIVRVGGEDVAALGSDFDGYVSPPIDVTGLPQLTELILQRGWSEERIRKILGENVLRTLDRLGNRASETELPLTTEGLR